MQKSYVFCSLCLIPVFTLFLASGCSLTETNFSVIGNEGGRQAAFLSWGALTGNYFYLYSRALMEEAELRDGLTLFLLTASLMLFLTAVGLPYLPQRVPGISRLHVWISFSSMIVMALSQIRLLILLQKMSGVVFGLQWVQQGILYVGSAVLFFGIGIVSSILEIFVTFGICIYLVCLDRKIKDCQ